MQTISIPYRCSNAGYALIGELRRIYSAAVRTAYANALGEAGRFRTEKDLRHLVKARFAGGVADAWLLHCATLEGRDKRRLVPAGTMIFGGKKEFFRRMAGQINEQEWKATRLLPLASRGDKLFKGNRHFRLSSDGRSCTLQMYGIKHALDLPRMTGNAGEILRQAAALAATKQINITFRLDERKLHVTIDPEDLPDHPERRMPVKTLGGRALGIDLNPEWIGISAVANTINPAVIEGTRLLDFALVQLPRRLKVTTETIRETLAAVCARVIGMARKNRCGTIVLERGLGKLRSSGKNRMLNGMINYWARTIFHHMLARKARLCGIEIVEVWGGYSTTIGNLAFEAPDACASAAEIGRRGIALQAGGKEVLPAMAPEVWLGRWKDQDMPKKVSDDLQQATSWGELHRKIKRAKLGVRRPHPESRETHGLAVRCLGLKHRPGCLWRPGSLASEQHNTTRSSSGSQTTPTTSRYE